MSLSFAVGAVSADTIQLADSSDLPWMDKSLAPEARSKLLIDAMSLDQKIQQIAMKPVANTNIPGCGFSSQGRHVEGIPELAIPTLRMTNGPFGGGDCAVAPTSTGLTSALTVASSFDPAVSSAWGDIIGEETRASGHNVLLTPGINLGRVPNAGRNFEYFGEDPYLAGVMAVAQVNAVQAHGVQSVAKHFAANEQETSRQTMDTIVDDRTMHELYLLPFEMTIQEANLASVMCSYPHLNGVYACESSELLTDWLREDLGFKGYVMSDRGATHSTAPAIKAGLDLEFASPRWFTPELIHQALDTGELTVADINKQLDRRYTVMIELGQFDDPINSLSPIDFAANGRRIQDIGEQGSVLLKNDHSTLPLKAASLKSVALIGTPTFAGSAKFNSQGPSNEIVVTSPYTVTPEQGLNNALHALGSDASVTYNNASNIAEAAALAAKSDVAVVMVGDISREGVDRTSLALPVTDGVNQDALVAAVAAANPNTVVVLKNGGPVLLPWLDKVPAVLEAWYPGQEDGNIVANLLLGIVNPSGKLPISFPTQEREAATATPAQWPGIDPDGAGPLPLTATYSEGLEMGYRWYDAQGIDPLFAFGYGLSYTNFEISKLAVSQKTSDGSKPFQVSFVVKNTGDVAGAEVPQVYLGLPKTANQPPKRLVGFKKVWLAPGEEKQISITIDPAASNHPMSTWDADANHWTTHEGTYAVYVGNSSNQITLTDSITVKGSSTAEVSASLTGDSSVMAGKAFDLNFGLNNVTQNVYAEELTLNFDPAKLDFVDATSLKTGLQVISKEVKAPGKVRIILASLGEGNAIHSDGDLLSLKLKAKSNTQTASTDVKLTNIILADGNGVETPLASATHSISIGYIKGDLNGDGKVSIGDLGIVAAAFGKTDKSPDWDKYKAADVNGDGIIDIKDLSTVAQLIE
ncbi:beta-glucosidase [Paenibacillus castaneae]|uniref:glycoside hydrolase family 3 C-terminal domain-containing protein n=1 Tax=Paenibacillus castaneae TaxID=474957 RepID=UPI000C9A97AC|nr:glycoside hydrolase family 3 C-terminal domain-containing protein [Paenibacillus castaneae]NIK79560.1 beta-glucosidase [Paenibacillus castaneae]